jgi:ribosome-associated toxin RatA of RatAB toxin-antitoxin module
MPRHEEQAALPYSADELFTVVAHVKDDPLFVPWCSGAGERPASRTRCPRLASASPI